MPTKFIGITGPKKSGKTTAIELLVPKLQEKNYRIGTIKIAFKDVSIDINQEHYDVIRHRKASPDLTLFKSKIETTLFYNKQMTLREAILQFCNDLDFVLIEGFSDDLEGFPQIVFLNEKGQEDKMINDYTVALSSIPEFSTKSSNKKFVSFEKIIDIIEKKALPIIPELNCKHCGYDSCKEFIKEVIKGNTQLTNCDVLKSESSEVILKVNDKLVHCNPFVQRILKNVLNGLIISLKTEEQEILTSEIKIINKLVE